MIQKFSITRLHNGEYIQLMSQTLGIANGSEAASILAPKMNALQTTYKEINDLYVNDPASAFTATIVVLDDVRDGLVSGLIKFCDANTNHPAASKSAAATTLARNLAVYGAGITAKSYNEETAIINNILADWTTQPDLINAGKELNTKEWLVALGEANKKFDDTYLQRTTDNAANDIAYNIKQKRLEANVAYAALIKKIDSYHEVNEGAAPWDSLVGKLNVLNEQYKVMLATRAGNGTKNGAPEEPKS